jgi:hypothetical protein
MAVALLGILGVLGLVFNNDLMTQRRAVQKAADEAAHAATVLLLQNATVPTAYRTLTEQRLCQVAQDHATNRNDTLPGMFQIQYASHAMTVNCSSTAPARTYSDGGNGIQVIAGKHALLFGLPIPYVLSASASYQLAPTVEIKGCCVHPMAISARWLTGEVNQSGQVVSFPIPKYDPNNPNDPFDPMNVPTSQRFRFWADDMSTPGPQDIIGGNRAWINPSCKRNRDLPDEACSISNAQMKEWMMVGYQGSVMVGDELRSDAGIRSTVLYEAQTKIASGDPFVVMPVYDSWVSVGSVLYMRVTGFAAFRMTSVTNAGSQKYIEGYFYNFIALDEMADAGLPLFGAFTIQKIQ